MSIYFICRSGSNWKGDWLQGKKGSYGIGQITGEQKSSPYGNPLENNNFGLRCYVLRNVPIRYFDYSCAFCFTKNEIGNIPNFENYYELESVHDQANKNWSATYMKRRIKLVIDACSKQGRTCRNTDIFIAAALGQNGPGFSKIAVNDVIRLDKDRRSPEQTFILDWGLYFGTHKWKDTQEQLRRFNAAIQELKKRNWIVSEIDDNYVENLINGVYDVP